MSKQPTPAQIEQVYSQAKCVNFQQNRITCLDYIKANRKIIRAIAEPVPFHITGVHASQPLDPGLQFQIFVMGKLPQRVVALDRAEMHLLGKKVWSGKQEYKSGV